MPNRYFSDVAQNNMLLGFRLLPTLLAVVVILFTTFPIYAETLEEAEVRKIFNTHVDPEVMKNKKGKKYLGHLISAIGKTAKHFANDPRVKILITVSEKTAKTTIKFMKGKELLGLREKVKLNIKNIKAEITLLIVKKQITFNLFANMTASKQFTDEETKSLNYQLGIYDDQIRAMRRVIEKLEKRIKQINQKLAV